MEYTELPKHFERVREYMQYFYIYGFLTRDEFVLRSPRSYDEERRRVEGWLSEYMGFRMQDACKSVFISFDSRDVRRNPLYRALKTQSFTDRDITLHFILLDVLADGEPHTVPQIKKELDARIDKADSGMLFDPKTLSGKLKEYEQLGLVSSSRKGRSSVYTLADKVELTQLAPMLAFFSEVAPCGVIGSFMEDRLTDPCESFRMKHHHIAHTLDSDLLCQLLEAIGEHRWVTITHMDRIRMRGETPEQTKARQARKEPNKDVMLPLCILQSVQDGRCYLVGQRPRQQTYQCCRLDRIQGIKPGKVAEDFEERRRAYMATRANRWSVSHMGKTPQHIEFTIRTEPYEEFIRRRMYRECRCGRVEEIDGGRTMKFSAELYDPAELLPWVRTFIGRITSFACENQYVCERFWGDIARMNGMYAAEEPAGEVQA